MKSMVKSKGVRILRVTKVYSGPKHDSLICFILQSLYRQPRHAVPTISRPVSAIEFFHPTAMLERSAIPKESVVFHDKIKQFKNYEKHAQIFEDTKFNDK